MICKSLLTSLIVVFLACVAGCATGIYRGVMTSDGKVLITMNPDGYLCQWDVEGRKKAHPYSGELSPTCGCITADGKQLITGDLSGKATVWDLANHKKLLTFSVDTERVTDIAVSKDGKFLAAVMNEKRIDIFDFPNRKFLRRLKPGGSLVKAVGFSPQGDSLVVVGHGSPEIEFWNHQTGKISSKWKGEWDQGYDTLAFSPDGRYMATGKWYPYNYLDKGAFNRGAYGGEILLWDLQEKKQLARLDASGTLSKSDPAISLAFSPDGKFLASGHFDGELILWDVEKRKMVREMGSTFFDNHGHFFFVGFSSDGSSIITGDHRGSIVFWNTSSGSVEKKLRWD